MVFYTIYSAEIFNLIRNGVKESLVLYNNYKKISRCEAFSTYPRTYDLIHANGVFSLYKNV